MGELASGLALDVCRAQNSSRGGEKARRASNGSSPSVRDPAPQGSTNPAPASRPDVTKEVKRNMHQPAECGDPPAWGGDGVRGGGGDARGRCATVQQNKHLCRGRGERACPRANRYCPREASLKTRASLLESRDTRWRLKSRCMSCPTLLVACGTIGLSVEFVVALTSSTVLAAAVNFSTSVFCLADF